MEPDSGAEPAALTDLATAAVVRHGRLRALIGLLGGLAALTLAIVLITIAGNRQDDLERHGVKVDGIVVHVSHPIRGPDSVDYRYTFGSNEYVGHIGASNVYEIGERVTVSVDPEQPERSTLPDEQPQSGFAYWVTIFSIVFGLTGFGTGAASLYLWRRRRRILRSSPWRRRSLRIELLSRGRLRLVDSETGVAIRLGRHQAVRLTLPGSPEANFRVARHGPRAVVSSMDLNELALGRTSRYAP